MLRFSDVTQPLQPDRRQRVGFRTLTPFSIYQVVRMWKNRPSRARATGFLGPRTYMEPKCGSSTGYFLLSGKQSGKFHVKGVQ